LYSNAKDPEWISMFYVFLKKPPRSDLKLKIGSLFKIEKSFPVWLLIWAGECEFEEAEGPFYGLLVKRRTKWTISIHLGFED